MTDKTNIQKTLATKIGASLSARRKRTGWTQGELAEKVGVDNETISRFERGATMPSLVTLQMLAVALNTTMADLVSEASAMPNDQAHAISGWLTALNESDRDFVTRQLKEWCDRLGHG